MRKFYSLGDRPVTSLAGRNNRLIAAAMAKAWASLLTKPAICNPSGRPSSWGSEIAGMPSKEACTVRSGVEQPNHRHGRLRGEADLNDRLDRIGSRLLSRRCRSSLRDGMLASGAPRACTRLIHRQHALGFEDLANATRIIIELGGQFVQTPRAGQINIDDFDDTS